MSGHSKLDFRHSLNNPWCITLWPLAPGKISGPGTSLVGRVPQFNREKWTICQGFFSLPGNSLPRNKQGKTTCKMSAIPSYGWGYLAGSFTWLPQWTFLTLMTLNFLVLQGISDIFSALEISPKWLEISVEFSNIRYKEWWCRNNNSWVQSKIHWKTGPRHYSPLHHEFHHCTARADWLYGVVRIRVCQRLAFWSPMSWTWAAGVPWWGAMTAKELMVSLC